MMWPQKVEGGDQHLGYVTHGMSPASDTHLTGKSSGCSVEQLRIFHETMFVQGGIPLVEPHLILSCIHMFRHIPICWKVDHKNAGLTQMGMPKCISSMVIWGPNTPLLD